MARRLPFRVRPLACFCPRIRCACIRSKRFRSTRQPPGPVQGARCLPFTRPRPNDAVAAQRTLMRETGVGRAIVFGGAGPNASSLERPKDNPDRSHIRPAPPSGPRIGSSGPATTPRCSGSAIGSSHGRYAGIGEISVGISRRGISRSGWTWSCHDRRDHALAAAACVQ